MASVISSFEQDAVQEPKRWTVEQFLRFSEAGELGDESERFELLDGEILGKVGQNDLHAQSIRLASRALRLVFGEGFDVTPQVPISLGEFNRPEPDITVLRGDTADFNGRPPTPQDVALLVEVVDSRMDTARRQKVSIHARAGIAEYWIVDLRRRVVEVRRGPIAESGEWTETRIYLEGESITPPASTGSVPVKGLWPPA